MNTLAIKLLLMPLVMTIVSHATKKWGHTIAGIISCLPWVAGPILLFIAIEQGSEFATHSIPGVMIGILGWFSFCFAYAYYGRKHNPIKCTIAGYLAYVVIVFAFKDLPELLGLNLCFILTLVLITIAASYFPHLKEEYTKPLRAFRYDLLLRIITSTLIVITITYLAKYLGPTWSGIIIPIPVITAVLALFTHYTQGMDATINLFKGLVIGIYGFTFFLFLQAYLLPRTSLFLSFMIGILFNILVTILVRWILNKLNFFDKNRTQLNNS